ncbi:NAD-dependent epimerase/dehydratase family protein [Rubripirellula reticaptiva]|uniref:UDP-glucose 4-epimerase n=1 Tax=Rubripirellula reticaptiva TaxID=2528013 RepID=A0A5C6FA81_9BACT|nr:NAD(P)-dependent oxidoreductase [Rubripirellula reticaptiva]TWU57407.1 UDP-glucose 4-epimerase [Rubripirellula reticaptiva]
MKIGLTGATGFLGQAFVKRVVAEGHTVIAWRRDSNSQLDAASSGVTWINGRLGDQDAAIELAERSDVIVHAGLDRSSDGFMDWPADPSAYFQTNVIGSLQLIEAATSHSVRRFVFVSSGAVHEKIAINYPLDETHPLWPGSIYGAYKASVETLIHAYGHSQRLSCCSVRPTAIYGAADPVADSKWFSLVQAIIAGRSVDVSGGSKSVHVDDVVDTIRLLLETDQRIDGETYNCCDRMISEHEVAMIAKRLSKSESVISGSEKVAKNKIDTSKIQKLGFTFGGTSKLEATIRTLIDAGNTD